MRVLIIDDEPEMAGLLSTALEDEGFAPDRVGDLEEASAALRLADYALIVLDRRLGDADGLSLLPEIRSKQPGAGILVLSALGEVADRVVGLDAGADDYLVKPFDADELRARVRAVVRRPRAPADLPPIVCGDLTFLPRERAFMVGGTVMDLRRRELAILETLIRRARRVVQREALVRAVYAFDEEPSSNTLDAHLSRLRRKLDAARAGIIIHAVRGVGYVMDEAR